MIKRSSAVTLIELLIAVTFFALIVIAAAMISVFGRYYLSSADKRAKVQNELSFALEYMTKYVSQGVGSNPVGAVANGFKVRVDPSAFNPALPPTSITTDDVDINFQLATNTLTASYTWAGTAYSDTLSTRVLSVATYGKIPDPVPVTPSGFYINFTDNFSVVEVCLVGRYLPGGLTTKDNPQVVLKTRVYARGASAR
ncbi:MAG: hypothetical protein NTZ92_05820 [Candidatus Omnitrophica bacterium]|nr:hypothetical protein [Candidatus Omnitrophota bacterium]